MSRNHRTDQQTEKMELKYCEHCGGLWVREPGTGVYCAKCEPKVADLPVPRKRPRRVLLPEGDKTVLDGIGRKLRDESRDLEAVGGVA